MEMDENNSPPREPRPSPVERDDCASRASPVRCPYCHEGLANRLDGLGSACVVCLARHHASCCWREGGSCAACQGNRASPEPGPEHRTRSRSAAKIRSWRFVALLIGLGRVGLAHLISHPSRGPPRARRRLGLSGEARLFVTFIHNHVVSTDEVP